MHSLRKFLFGLAICFGLPWFLLIVRPYANERGRQPVPYSDADGEAYPEVKGFAYPKARPGDKARGADVYERYGCGQCHTQVIRPAYAGIDQWKLNWGKIDPKSKGPVKTRWTNEWDYLGEDFAMIGQRRIGPDLANFRHRVTDEKGVLSPEKVAKVYLKLYAPKMVEPWSNHTAYKSLFEEKPIEGQVRHDALKFPDGQSPVKPGIQVVPTSVAKALVEYLCSLERDTHLPEKLTGVPPQKEK